MLLLKHIRDWSFVTLEREVRGNLLYREFTHVGAEKVPDAKTLGRLAQALPPEVLERLHARIVGLAQERGMVTGKRMRLDTTVVESNIHYPTDSSLLGDGVRVLTRLMKRVTKITGKAGACFRDRTRSVQRRLIEIGRATRAKGAGAITLHPAFLSFLLFLIPLLLAKTMSGPGPLPWSFRNQTFAPESS